MTTFARFFFYRIALCTEWITSESSARSRAFGIQPEEFHSCRLDRRPKSAYEYLIASLGLPVEWMQPPEFAIRSYTHFKDTNPPEPILLNSFFLADLSLAKVLFANDELRITFDVILVSNVQGKLRICLSTMKRLRKQ